MKKLLTVVATMFAISAHAQSWFQFEAGLGVNQYSHMSDGNWYQQGAMYSLDTRSIAYSAGLRFNLYDAGSWGVRAHVDYVNLGHIGASCQCTSDENYNVSAHSIMNPAGPYADYAGSGTEQGVALTIEPYVRRHGWTLGVEGGAFPYRPDWNETVSGGVGLSPYVWHIGTPHALKLGAVIGFNIERANLGISYRHYWLPSRFTDSELPSFANGADVLMLTYHY